MKAAQKDQPTQSAQDAKLVRDDVQECLDAGHKDQAAFLLYLSGYSITTIVHTTGYTDWREAKRAINRLLRQGQVVQRDLRQASEIARLNRLETKLQPQIEQGNVEAIRTAIEVSRERRRILADNEPARVAPPQMPSQEEINRFVEGLRARGIAVGNPQQFVADFRERALAAGYLPEGQILPTDATLDDVVEAESVDLEPEEGECLTG